MTKAEQIRAAKAEYQRLVMDLGKEAVREQLQGLFDAHPELEAVHWSQYTPYFNDGEPCTFGLNQVYYKLRGQDTGGDDDNGFEYIPYGDRGQTGLTMALRAFANSRDEDIYKECFGDHVEVTATRDGIEVAEYDHK